MKKISFITLTASLTMPFLAAAQSGINLNAITPYSNGIINFINGILMPVLFAIAFIYFIYGVYRYFILGADNETEREKGKGFILWGIIGFVIVISVWGIVAIVMNTLGLTITNAPPPPTINTSGTP